MDMDGWMDGCALVMRMLSTIVLWFTNDKVKNYKEPNNKLTPL
jgi:hypothetical protein